MSVSRTATRSYSSTLRADQQEQVRERILVKVGEVLADAETTELSVAEVARRAGVSVRTVYRYFPTKEALYDGFNYSFARRFTGRQNLPEDLDDFPEMVAALFQGFEKNADIVKAMRFSKAAGEVRRRRKASQRKAAAQALAEHTRHLDETSARGVAAVFGNLLSSEVWLNMTETWGLTTPQAASAVQWAVAALRARLERDGARRR